jgi:flagellar biosynthesis GTPase FlhF
MVYLSHLFEQLDSNTTQYTFVLDKAIVVLVGNRGVYKTTTNVDSQSVVQCRFV